MQFDNIYVFDVSYYNEKGYKAKTHIYSDSDDVFALKDLPETTYAISLSERDNDPIFADLGTAFKITKEYFVGERISLEEFEKIMGKLNLDSDQASRLMDAYEQMKSGKGNYYIYKVGKDAADCLVVGSRADIGRIRNGRIVPKSTKKEYEDKDYLDLE